MRLNAPPPSDDPVQRRLQWWSCAWLDQPLAWRREPGAAPRFSETAALLPAAFAEAAALPLARAAIAHIAAHRYYGGARFSVGRLTPIEVALVSLIEDARVEQLAMAARPGLRALWRPFHRAAGNATDAAGLLRRLAGALFDPGRADDNAWVEKGRRLFLQHRAGWTDPALSRRLGNLLGNDLGQMRLQFDWRRYQPEPYRDDHHGLWEFEAAEDIVVETSARQPEPGGSDAAPLRPDAQGGGGDGPAGAGPPAPASPAVALPEWDYARGWLRPGWVRLRQEAAPAGAAAVIDALLASRAGQARVLARRLHALRARRRRQRRRGEGDEPDLDACIEHAVARRGGRTPDHRVYVAATRPRRDLALMLLLDASQSTAGSATPDAPATLELEREAAALLAEAAHAAGDRCAIAAFRSAGRDDVRLTPLKSFAEPWDGTARAALAGVRPGLSTRLGAALRGAGRELARQPNASRWLVVISDGEPADIDAPDPRYLIEDARRAVAELARLGIAVFGLGWGPAAAAPLQRIFGRRWLLVEKPEQLAAQLQRIYGRLAESVG